MSKTFPPGHFTYEVKRQADALYDDMAGMDPAQRLAARLELVGGENADPIVISQADAVWLVATARQ